MVKHVSIQGRYTERWRKYFPTTLEHKQSFDNPWTLVHTKKNESTVKHIRNFYIYCLYRPCQGRPRIRRRYWRPSSPAHGTSCGHPGLSVRTSWGPENTVYRTCVTHREISLSFNFKSTYKRAYHLNLLWNWPKFMMIIIYPYLILKTFATLH